MIRFLADEDFNGEILRVLRRRGRHLDLLRVQDVEMMGRPDGAVLAWAAEQRRVLLTHDVTTMTAEASGRLRRGEPMAGVFAVPQFAPRDAVLESVELMNEASDTAEWVGRIVFLPFR